MDSSCPSFLPPRATECYAPRIVIITKCPLNAEIFFAEIRDTQKPTFYYSSAYVVWGATIYVIKRTVVADLAPILYKDLLVYILHIEGQRTVLIGLLLCRIET